MHRCGWKQDVPSPRIALANAFKVLDVNIEHPRGKKTGSAHMGKQAPYDVSVVDEMRKHRRSLQMPQQLSQGSSQTTDRPDSRARVAIR